MIEANRAVSPASLTNTNAYLCLFLFQIRPENNFTFFLYYVISYQRLSKNLPGRFEGPNHAVARQNVGN